MIRTVRDIRSWGKPVVAVFCIVCLVVFIRNLSVSWNDVAASISSFLRRPWLVTVEVALMILNIGVESVRWRCVRRAFTQGSWADDVKASLRGVSLGNVTPGNVGEHVGRASSYPEHGKAGAASVLSSVLQTAVIALMGGAASLGLARADGGHTVGIVGLCVFIVLAILTFLCGGSLLRKFGVRVGWSGGLCAAAFVNVLKVCVFSFQFALLLSGGGWPSPILFQSTLLYYFLITVIPRVNLIDVGVKGGVASWVFGSGLCSEATVNAAVIFIWVLNIVLPSIVGFATFVIRRKVSQ